MAESRIVHHCAVTTEPVDEDRVQIAVTCDRCDPVVFVIPTVHVRTLKRALAAIYAREPGVQRLDLREESSPH